jgi:hypothetical protein
MIATRRDGSRASSSSVRPAVICHNMSWIARFDVLGVEPFLHGHVFALDD